MSLASEKCLHHFGK